jgi:hypothetical protein
VVDRRARSRPEEICRIRCCSNNFAQVDSELLVTLVLAIMPREEY